MYFYENGLQTVEDYFHEYCPPHFMIPKLRDEHFVLVTNPVNRYCHRTFILVFRLADLYTHPKLYKLNKHNG